MRGLQGTARDGVCVRELMHLGVDSFHWSLARPLGVKVGGWHLVQWHHHPEANGKREVYG